jgi:hypothetical protein
VTNISLDEGLLYVNKLSESEDANTNYLSIYYGGSEYFGQQLIYGLEKSDLSEEYGSWSWSVANLTCESAKHDRTYACISTNSECLGVTHGTIYVGYCCKCSSGFEGNPYVQNGCTGVHSLTYPMHAFDCATIGIFDNNCMLSIEFDCMTFPYILMRCG